MAILRELRPNYIIGLIKKVPTVTKLCTFHDTMAATFIKDVGHEKFTEFEKQVILDSFIFKLDEFIENAEK